MHWKFCTTSITTALKQILYPPSKHSQLSLPVWGDFSTFCLCLFAQFTYFIYMKLYYLFFGFCFFHLTRCFQGSLHFATWIRTSFCILDKYYIIQWIYIPWICMYVCITIFSLTLVMELGCFFLLSVVDSVTMDICINNLLEPFSVL